MFRKAVFMGVLCVISQLVSGSAAFAQADCAQIAIREKILVSASGVGVGGGAFSYGISLNGFDLEPKQLLGLAVTHLDPWMTIDGNTKRAVVTATSGGDLNLSCSAYYDAIGGSTDDAGITCLRVPLRHLGDKVALRVTYCAE